VAAVVVFICTAIASFTASHRQAVDTALPLYECDEGNHGLKNILSAARAEERAKL
jgi:hypothetical protein